MPATLSLANELDSVNSNGSPARDGVYYLREIPKALVYEAAERTPLQEMPALSACLSNTVEIKREDLQTVHSFKIRGTCNAMRSLNPAEHERDVVTTLVGNRAQGMAHSATLLGTSVIVVIPTVILRIKVGTVRALGGEVHLHGGNFDAAKTEATRLVETEGLPHIVPFGDPHVTAGQGIIGLELIQQDAHLGRVSIPVGGGGLAAGVATLVKQLMPGIKVTGAEYKKSACLRVALLGGEPITLHHVGLFAGGVAIRCIGEETFRMYQALLDGVVIVSFDGTSAAIRDIFDDVRAISEPSGALTLAGFRRYIVGHHLSGERLVFVLPGANLNFRQLRYISEHSKIGEQREATPGATIPKEQGSFLRFASVLGVRSVTEFNYRLSAACAGTDPTRVFVGVRITRHQGCAEIVAGLEEAGYDVISLTDDGLAKVHVRSMTGRRVTPDVPERLFPFLFLEPPGALAHFLKVLGTRQNITLFHYRTDDADYGHILCAFATGSGGVELTERMNRLDYSYNEETTDPAFRLFPARQSVTSSRLHVLSLEGRRRGAVAGIMQ